VELSRRGPNALVRTIETVLNSPSEAGRRALAAREMVRQRYERGVVFDQLETLIRADCLRFMKSGFQ
jgi:hypothetical protein